MFRGFGIAGVVGVLCFGCGPGSTPETTDGRVYRTERDQFGLITCSAETADTTCYTGRTIIGVSMGAGGAGQLGFKRPELFDNIAMLGVPIVDWVYMLRNIERSYLGGFCDEQTILANLDQVASADPTSRAYCGPNQSVVKYTPDGKITEPLQDYNHWYRWIDEGRGGNYGRDKLRESFQDLSLAFGNAINYNPDSPYYARGLPADFRGWTQEDKCAQPMVMNNVKNKEYNPTGEYPVLAFCDTRTSLGEFDPERPSEMAMEIGLSVDYNRNGIRDFAEPVLLEMHERYEDLGRGVDDQYDWELNPSGKRGNWLWDEGEPYEDFGLDGVDNTGDYGEHNGKFDYNPNVLNYFAQNPRTLMENLEDGQLERLNIYADAGIRDFLMSVGSTNWLWGALTARVGADKARDYDDFKALTPSLSRYDFLAVDYSEEGIGKHAYVRYGNPDASERDIQRGDGHHVGPADQILNRFLTGVAFVQDRMFEPDHTAIDVVGDITDLIQPHKFMSPALGEERDFGVVLPPGYNDPANADKRYPVLYFLHGQGMESQQLLASAVLFFGYMAGSTREDFMRARKSDWAKFIIVFPDSTCSNDACGSGNFNTNHVGTDGNGPKYQDSLFELMAWVEQNYRTQLPVEVRK
jgi:hypothetical protein